VLLNESEVKTIRQEMLKRCINKPDALGYVF
jgi:hypothetical protein